MKQTNDYLKMDPLEVMNMLEQEMVFNIPPDVTTKENKIIAGQTITKAVAYTTYCAAMEEKAKLMKRAAKDKEEKERFRGLEEVFKINKDNAQKNMDNVTRLMTLRRLELDEEKNNYHIT